MQTTVLGVSEALQADLDHASDGLRVVAQQSDEDLDHVEHHQLEDPDKVPGLEEDHEGLEKAGQVLGPLVGFHGLFA